MLEEPTTTSWKRSQRKKCFLLISRGNIKRSSPTWKVLRASVKSTKLDMGVSGTNARVNHFCCLQQCSTPQEYARRLRALGEYHSRDIHEWDGGECGFHPKIVCSCKKCKEDEELQCQGKPYMMKNSLTCDYHWLQYRIECERRAEDADSVIHPPMGRGHSNLCEAHFTVLPNYRAKDQNLCR